jgi:hypothetical protein
VIRPFCVLRFCLLLWFVRVRVARAILVRAQVPFSQKSALAEQTNAVYNKHHSRGRMVVERTFGKLKAQWRILKSSRFSPRATALAIKATVVLHNMTVDDGTIYQLDDPVADAVQDGNQGANPHLESMADDEVAAAYQESGTLAARTHGEERRRELKASLLEAKAQGCTCDEWRNIVADEL